MSYLSALSKRRLLKLADFLEKEVKPNWFNLNRWADYGWKEKECGTTACAVGWATAIPSFRKAGLKLNNFRDPIFKKSTNWNAVKKFFDLPSRYDADYLFSIFAYRDEKSSKSDVIKRIRKFVKDDKKLY